jgi:hypothetical protein
MLGQFLSQMRERQPQERQDAQPSQAVAFPKAGKGHYVNVYV